jgi:hypothetical protein
MSHETITLLRKQKVMPHLLNLSIFDKGIEETFGRPNKVVEYANPLNKNGRIRWGCGYWWLFKDDIIL